MNLKCKLVPEEEDMPILKCTRCIEVPCYTKSLSNCCYKCKEYSDICAISDDVGIFEFEIARLAVLEILDAEK